MAPPSLTDLGQVVRGARVGLALLARPDRLVSELLEILRDTHRILAKLDRTIDRLEERAREAEDALREAGVDRRRLERLEQAVLNIERASLGAEAAMNALLDALPKAIRRRVEQRVPGAS